MLCPFLEGLRGINFFNTIFGRQDLPMESAEHPQILIKFNFANSTAFLLNPVEIIPL